MIAKRWVVGAPAVASIVAGVAVAAWLAARSPADRAGWYPAAADAAFDAGDYRTAAVCYARALQTRPPTPDVVFNLAVSLDATGQPDAARGLFLRLAPPDTDAGYAPAHLRLIKADLSADRPAPAAVADAAARLVVVRRHLPADDAEVAYWSALAAAAAGRWDEAHDLAQHAGPLHDVLADRLARLADAKKSQPQMNTDAHR